MPKFHKGDKLVCLKKSQADNVRGWSIYTGEIYYAANDSSLFEGEEQIELIANGSGEPLTFYPVRCFDKFSNGKVVTSGFVTDDDVVFGFKSVRPLKSGEQFQVFSDRTWRIVNCTKE